MKIKQLTAGLLSIVMLSACSLDSTEKKADPIAELLLKRHSGYSFDPTRQVSDEQLQAIVKAGQLAPSSYNDQPWRFIICNRATDPAAYDKAFSALVEFNQNWVKNVPVLVVVIASSISPYNNSNNRWAQYDTGAAAFSMMVQATSLGLMAHQMGGFDEKKMSEVFSIPADYVPMAVMAIGYPAADEPEAPAKNRNPISHSFFTGSWPAEAKKS